MKETLTYNISVVAHGAGRRGALRFELSGRAAVVTGASEQASAAGRDATSHGFSSDEPQLESYPAEAEALAPGGTRCRPPSSMSTEQKNGWRPAYGDVDQSIKIPPMWLAVVSLAILYNVVFVIGRAVFWELDHLKPPLWFTLDYLCDAIYVIDTIVHAHEAGPGSNSASFVDAVSRLPTLSLTQFSGRDQNWLSFMNTSDSLVNSDLRSTERCCECKVEVAGGLPQPSPLVTKSLERLGSC
ncbi:Cyclic nucleotide-gated cation channel subunit A [Eumeta japonica]|uniref:Cyclic nucleotide-gated cation channel subunit A n=1 Tax=Eumeta variegata TaxID=151549 RepID=A0A4C1S9U5_EUMVA|nr:Cyclic nucleotide-gated cation channel subunit A [Eumeta japonica]